MLLQWAVDRLVIGVVVRTSRPFGMILRAGICDAKGSVGSSAQDISGVITLFADDGPHWYPVPGAGVGRALPAWHAVFHL